MISFENIFLFANTIVQFRRELSKLRIGLHCVKTAVRFRNLLFESLL